MTSRDHARLLLSKARDDAAVVGKLASDPEIADSVVGFHVQQAIEKALKAVLASNERPYPWTHDLTHLFELMLEAGLAFPDHLREARRLTPWATEFRYGETIDEALDRDAALAGATVRACPHLLTRH